MHRTPLPQELNLRSFTLAQQAALGVSRNRVRAQDLKVVSRGLRIPLESDLKGPAALLAYTEEDPGAAIMDLTAAEIHHMPLPSYSRGDWRVYLGRSRGRNRARRKNVVGRTVTFKEGEVVLLEGLRITSPARTWLDLAGRLRLEDLVAAGDFLVCEHGPESPAPRRGICTVTDLEKVIERHSGMRGVKTARAAVALIRVGADSPQETALRLVLGEHGLPEPVLNHVLRTPDGRARVWPDLAYLEARLSIQYDGVHHEGSDQYRRDIRRQALTEQLGWREVRISKDDLEGRFPHAVTKIRRKLEESGWDSSSRDAS
ncbi:endonuclease domain-containing protein [Arthrobacter sp. NPDC090010]|uniref:endonuclease domain-containing protein n=1 Tax=Arthrobacter sp. NPDC090010 TaxID=3363942 RepID=UPI0037FA5EC0